MPWPPGSWSIEVLRSRISGLPLTDDRQQHIRGMFDGLDAG
ncbi:MAG TPA: hypothetical protein VK631_27205 [Solirubrobacteraceae bacterium]|nr:hypothetical protein [Solirubrobacteraceae bacterium]